MSSWLVDSDPTEQKIRWAGEEGENQPTRNLSVPGHLATLPTAAHWG